MANLFRRGSARFEAGKADALARLRQAEAVASDETGVRIQVNNMECVCSGFDGWSDRGVHHVTAIGMGLAINVNGR